jgi:hypothetical protein
VSALPIRLQRVRFANSLLKQPGEFEVASFKMKNRRCCMHRRVLCAGSRGAATLMYAATQDLSQ